MQNFSSRPDLQLRSCVPAAVCYNDSLHPRRQFNHCSPRASRSAAVGWPRPAMRILSRWLALRGNKRMSLAA